MLTGLSKRNMLTCRSRPQLSRMPRGCASDQSRVMVGLSGWSVLSGVLIFFLKIGCVAAETLSLSLYIYIYIYVYIYIYIHVSIYESLSLSLSLYIYIYVCFVWMPPAKSSRTRARRCSSRRVAVPT